MDKGSFGRVYKQIGPIDIDVVEKIALAMLERLMHLCDVRWITHQDGLLATPLSMFPHITVCTGQNRSKEDKVEGYGGLSSGCEDSEHSGVATAYCQ